MWVSGRGRRIYNGKLSQIFINFLRERSPSKWNDPFGHGPGIWGWQQSGSWWQKAESSNGVVAEGAQFAPAPILLLVPTYLQLGVAVRPFSLRSPHLGKEGRMNQQGWYKTYFWMRFIMCIALCLVHSIHFLKRGWIVPVKYFVKIY